MGGIEAAKFGAMGFIADRLLGTGFLATAAGAAYGGLFRPDAGEMSAAYDKRRATVGDTLKSFFGYEMPDGLFGSAAKTGRRPEDLRPNGERAAANAAAKEKKDGLPWGKLLLAGGAGMLGVSLLDNLITNPLVSGIMSGVMPGIMPGLMPGIMPGMGPFGPFSGGAYAPFGAWGGGLHTVLPMALMAMLGLRGNFLF